MLSTSPSPALDLGWLGRASGRSLDAHHPQRARRLLLGVLGGPFRRAPLRLGGLGIGLGVGLGLGLELGLGPGWGWGRG